MAKTMDRSSFFVEENGNGHAVAACEQEIGDLDPSAPKSAHRTDHDPWQQVGLLLVTSFNCVYILGYSNLILVPLGMVWGIIAMIVLGAFSLYANIVLSKLFIIDGKRFIRYRDLVGFALGRKMHYLVWGLQFLHFTLCNMGFLLLSGKSLKEVCLDLKDDVDLKLGEFIGISGAIYYVFSVVVPHLSAMGIWSALSAFLTSAYVIILVVVATKDGRSAGPKDYHVPGNREDMIFNAMGAIAAVVFTNNSGMLPEIQATLKRPAVKNMQRALYLQFSLGLGIYYGVTVLGYWAYGSSVSEYLLNDISGPKWARITANSAAFLQTVVSQHIFCVPVHEALDTRFLRLDEHEYSLQNTVRRLLMRGLFFSLSTLAAAMFPFIADFVGLVGSLAITPLTFVFPSMIFLKIHGAKCGKAERLWHAMIIILSVLMTLATTCAALRVVILNSKTYDLFADT